MRQGSLARCGAFVALISLLFTLPPPSPTGAQTGGIQLAVDTSNPNQDGLLVLYSGERFGGEIGLPVGAGDINGDGRDDVIFCAMYASAGPGFRRNNGRVYFYISDGRDTGEIDAAQNPPNIFSLIGKNDGDLLGTSVATGDVNGDGLADVAIGAGTADGLLNRLRFNSGAVYLVMGREIFNGDIDLNTLDGLPPQGVTVIYGPQTNGRAGIWVDIGDLDGDGFGDIVIGSDQLSFDGETHAGGAIIVFGQLNMPREIDLANFPDNMRMTLITGVDEEDHWGSMLHVGDIDNDGHKDLAIAGAIFRDSGSFVTPDDDTGHEDRAANFNGTRPRCGEVFVLYGQNNWPERIDLKNPPANATHIIGAQERDRLGSQMHSADLNGDGQRDFIIGALQALAPDNRGRPGAVYVIYGGQDLHGRQLDLADPAALNLQMSTIYGINNLDCAGDSVRTYDINNDGFAELFIGSPEHSFIVPGETVERDDAGDTKFIFGQPGFLPPVVKLYAPPPGLPIYQLAGARGADPPFNDGDEMSYRLTGGDVDGDGYIDFIANAMHGDGFLNRLVNAGNVYIFSGKKLSARLGRLPEEPDSSLKVDAAQLQAGTQPVQQALAGQPGLRLIVNGDGFRADTEIVVNGQAVASEIPPQQAETRRIVNLDQNPAVRNMPGDLVVQARHTNPATGLTPPVIAGRLLGPQITEINTKRKGAGKFIVILNGVNFQNGATVSVRVGDQLFTPTKVKMPLPTRFKAVFPPGTGPASGSQIRVQVLNFGVVASNEVMTTAK